MPHTTASKIYSTEQIDSLYMPKDNGYKYILVIVDIATRLMDAEPMKDREAKTTVKALEKIFKRKIVQRPLRLEVDAGREFEGDFEKHFKRFFKIFRKEVGRHRQQAVVETKNYQVGTILNHRMLAEEINNDKVSRNWVDILPKVVALINKNFAHEAQDADPDLLVRTDKFSEEVLPIGTKVRIQLDNPISYVDDKKLYGKFRAGDIRWKKQIGEITRFFLRPDQPVLYQVDNNDNVAYTKYQLQVVKDNEVKPAATAQKQFYAQKILKKKKEDGLVYYQVLWEDKTKTWEPRKNLINEIPDMIKEFETKNKK
jgi:hypothetical protein